MPDKAAPPAPQSKAKVFVRRLSSTLVLWGIVLAAMFSGNKYVSDYVFLALLLLLTFTALLEFYGLVGKLNFVCFKNFGLVGGLLLIAGSFGYLTAPPSFGFDPRHINDFETSFLVLFVLGLCVRQFVSRSNTAGILAISTTLFGFMYVAWLLNFIQKIYFFPGVADNGKFFLLYFILVTKFSDTGAYAIGSLIGRHKMIPRISPGKTWEGFGGAIVVSTGASIVFVHYLAGRLPGMTLLHATILGALLSMTAVIGDLIESLFKREAGLKDSGTLFPGIGGILDLLDSLLFNAPIMYLYMRYFVHPI